eukprot:UN34312
MSQPDVDDCETGEHNCHSDATCTNTPPGSHTCECKNGYSGDGETCIGNDCIDVHVGSSSSFGGKTVDID